MSTSIRRSAGGGHRGWTFSISLAALAIPALLAAQQPTQADSSHCICWNQGAVNLSRHMPALLALGRRAMIGITMGMAADSGRGVRVADVTEGGPAARAGLKKGDVLTRIDDVDLGSKSASKAQDALVEHLQDVEPGDTVSVAYLRNGRTQNARIVTESASRMGIFTSVGPGGRVIVSPGRQIETWVTPRTGDLPDVVRTTRLIRSMAGIPGLDLVDLNAGLGKYFGTDKGVLVVNVNDDSKLGLKAGDVIQEIGSRTPEDARQAMQILQSYRPDEQIQMQVMRDKRRTTVTGHMR